MSTMTNLSSRISVTVAEMTECALSAPKLESASSFSIRLILFGLFVLVVAEDGSRVWLCFGFSLGRFRRQMSAGQKEGLTNRFNGSLASGFITRLGGGGAGRPYFWAGRTRAAYSPIPAATESAIF